MSPELKTLLKRAKEWWDSATEAERKDMLARQRRSYVLAEIGMGNDEDELAYRDAYARDEAIREVSRLGRELGAEQARLAEAVEWVREARKFCQDGLAGDGCTPQQALERIHEASGDILAKLEGRS